MYIYICTHVSCTYIYIYIYKEGEEEREREREREIPTFAATFMPVPMPPQIAQILRVPWRGGTDGCLDG